MSHLVLQNLTKYFHTIAAVRDLWLEVRSGEVLSLLGPSGCGKSTTLQMVAGVLRPDSGVIQLDGKTLNAIPPEKRDVALVLQRGLLFPHLTVGENVAFGLKMRGIGRAERDAQAAEMLRQVQLEGFGDRKSSELSGGQAQRVALARSLVIAPKLLLLDEPLSALDANLREEMQDLILRLQAQTGVTMLVVTHDQAEAVVLSDRIALMFEGRLRQVATPEQLYRQPCDESTARFMGGVNFFPAQAYGHRWQLATGETLSSATAQEGTVHVTIRPEQVRVLNHPSSGTNTFAAKIMGQRFTGTQRRLTLSLASELVIQAWVNPVHEWAIAQQVWVHLPPEALWSFPTAEPAGTPLHVS
ncbi:MULTISPECIES: ABC transporter ATP-binding protein [unclassified Leptolyngbya]|uniref:ABC transporter ATP-binding protein n=1 Tax=unclassified Leptolyngbya TaxID=2650499 RepID=UPI0016828AE9|nr:MULTISPECIES: ABC transporter ATP-binding protein [unclassified Leptolyngbya]MBD1913794.1 ABC transporter ATP-binding protein [Leptolyngbya sp. FACHB-8]MBD2153610.1 ABC transporter ATP-binding protein [Leptolyngbya sp. FACHB-16]